MRRAFLLAMSLALVLAGAPVRAEPVTPATVDVGGWTVQQYNDTLVARQREAILGFHDAMRRLYAAPASPEALAAFFAEVRAEANAALLASAALPPWNGDSTLRDALVASYQWFVDTCDTAFLEALDLLGRANVRNADLSRLEALNQALEAEALAHDEWAVEVQRAFARRHRMELYPSEQPEPPDAGPPFTAPGVPPAGSRLDGAVHVSFAVRYENSMVDLQNRMVEAMNRFMDASAARLPRPSPPGSRRGRNWSGRAPTRRPARTGRGTRAFATPWWPWATHSPACWTARSPPSPPPWPARRMP